MNPPKRNFAQWLVRWAILALGVTIAANVVDGIHYDSLSSLLVVVLLLSFFNEILRPILLLFALPFIVLTLGLGVLVINALLFLAVDGLVGGFHVEGFWSALGGSIIVSVTSLVLDRFTRPRPPVGPPMERARAPTVPAPARSRGGRDDDVIDI